MKQIYKYVAFFLVLISCTEDINVLEDVTINDGGYIEFENIPTLAISTKDFLDPDATFLEPLIDNNKSAESYKITAFFNENVVEDFIVINSFPADLTFKYQDLADALGVTVQDFNELTEVRFLGTVTTKLGDYSGVDPIDGGNTLEPLLRNPRQALQFIMTFFTPPPYHVRKTSFEEPLGYGSGIDYVKAGPTTESEVLQNHPNEPIVTYVAKGTTRDDELGFTTEVINSATSTGFGFDAEEIGVTNQLVDFTSYPDGEQGFRIEDVDNTFRMTFDTVDIPVENTTSGVQIKVFFKPTTWEDEDYLTIYANIVDDNGPRVLEIFSIRGADDGLDDIDAIEGRWITIDTGFLDNIKSYQVVIDSETTQNAEEITWDNLLIYIPDPE